MVNYTLRHLAKFLSTIWLIAAVTFLLINTAPALRYSGHHLFFRDEEQAWQFKRFDFDQPLVQHFFSYMLIDVEKGRRAEISRLDFGAFGVYQIGPENGSTLECGVVCLNFGPSYRQRGVDVEDILFGPLP
jgi:ABC-type dipeptide/oligopeptide/nickel transport system permease component